MEEFLYEPDFKLPVQERFKGYFIGAISDFSDIKVSFEGLREFPERVLKALRKVSAGRAVSYGQLAELAGCPKGGRAVGTILKKNPVPLIIPCHRVIKADGSLGNFMGNEPRGSYFKEKMLQLEGF
jgi:O-6-methylguanine DNA methyltransferase